MDSVWLMSGVLFAVVSYLIQPRWPTLPDIVRNHGYTMMEWYQMMNLAVVKALQSETMAEDLWLGKWRIGWIWQLRVWLIESKCLSVITVAFAACKSSTKEPLPLQPGPPMPARARTWVCWASSEKSILPYINWLNKYQSLITEWHFAAHSVIECVCLGMLICCLKSNQSKARPGPPRAKPMPAAASSSRTSQAGSSRVLPPPPAPPRAPPGDGPRPPRHPPPNVVEIEDDEEEVEVEVEVDEAVEALEEAAGYQMRDCVMHLVFTMVQLLFKFKCAARGGWFN